MDVRPPFDSRRRRNRLRRDWRLVGLLLLLAVVLLTESRAIEFLCALHPLQTSEPFVYAIVAALALFVCAALMLTRQGRFLWHSLANAMADGVELRLTDPWVVDGDTIDDRALGIRYRLANIDAPETGDNAKCFRERERGELAKRTAIQLVRRAKTVTVRRTWRTDRHRRRVAFVLVDGRDLGQVLIELGLARPWRGRRERWCGRRGGLARIAETGAMPFACSTCKGWR